MTMHETDVAIQVRNVSKRFILPHEKNTSVKAAVVNMFKSKNNEVDIQHALEDISFEVKKGEFFGIVGRNGSGKSTLLKILAEIYQPSSGTLSHTGKLVPFIELGVGFNPELTGRENVFLNGALLGFTRKEVEALYDDIVKFAELQRFMDQKLKNYSSGMQVRLAFSMAIQAKADILLIDEVLAVGDAAFQRKCLDYFGKLKKEKCTVVFVSHDMDAVRQFCDRAVLIEKSRVVEEGTADKIAEHYSRLFLNDAQANAVSPTADTESISRWGSQKACFVDVALSTETLTDAEPYIKFKGKVKFKAEIEKPIIGFKVADGGGRLITGTNSALLHVDIPKHISGDELSFSWVVPNIFSNGDHEVSLALIEGNGSDVDIWDSVLKFSVYKPIKTPYIVTPDLKLNVTSKNG